MTIAAAIWAPRAAPMVRMRAFMPTEPLVALGSTEVTTSVAIPASDNPMPAPSRPFAAATSATPSCQRARAA